MSISKGTPFRLNLPVELVKGGETENGWKIRGLASTENVDLQGEIVKQRGLDISPIKEGRGWINYNHSNDPEDMIGKLDDADVGNKGLMVEGYLFKKHRKSQAVYSILKSLDDKDKHSIKLSIEGNILKRAGRDNKTIASAKVDKVALTFDPINTYTYVELVKAITDTNKELEMKIPDIAPTQDLTAINLTQPEDGQEQFNDPANSTDDADGAIATDMDNGEDKPGKEYTGAQGAKFEDVHMLLTEIKDMLTVLVGDKLTEKANQEKADMMKSLREMIAQHIKEALTK